MEIIALVATTQSSHMEADMPFPLVGFQLDYLWQVAPRSAISVE